MSNIEIIGKFNEISAKISALILERSAPETQVEALAKEQIAIARTAISECKPSDFERFGHELDSYRRMDRLVIDSDGTIMMWEDGTCGDRDEELCQFKFHPWFVDGKYDDYKQFIKDKIAQQRDLDKVVKRNKLTTELANAEKQAQRLREQLAAV